MSTHNDVDPKSVRRGLGLTQQEAATRAGVSLATWRRWEFLPSSVSDPTAQACARVLMTRSHVTDLDTRWTTDPNITARQAAALIGTLRWWSDVALTDWLEPGGQWPLHEIGPFRHLDLRVMMLIGDNTAYATLTRDRCQAIADEITRGALPFERESCYFDEVVMAAALEEAPTLSQDETWFDDSVHERPGDHDWEEVADHFDDIASWHDWRVPVGTNDPGLRPLLEIRHPFGWFDLDQPHPDVA